MATTCSGFKQRQIGIHPKHNALIASEVELFQRMI